MLYGACSICGGRVIKPDVWHGIISPQAQCERCHAVMKLPIVQMEAPKQMSHVAFFDTKTLGWS